MTNPRLGYRMLAASAVAVNALAACVDNADLANHTDVHIVIDRGPSYPNGMVSVHNVSCLDPDLTVTYGGPATHRGTVAVPSRGPAQ